VKYIRNDLERTLLWFEENLVETSMHVEEYQKGLLFKVMKNKHVERYISQQKRNRALRAPLSVAVGAFQRILGVEKVEPGEDEIDTRVLDEHFEVTKNILDSLDFEQCLGFFTESMKVGLTRANEKWMKEL
jgi:hypothetical protein